MRRNWLWICVILVMGWVAMFNTSSTATAGMTVNDVANYQSYGDWFVPVKGHPISESTFRYANQDWGWQHMWDVPNNRYLTSAKLIVTAWDVDTPVELNYLYGDGELLGSLVGRTDRYSKTTFDLMSIRDELADGALNVYMDIDYDNIGAAVAVWRSKLALTYKIGSEPIHSPVPGAALLGFMGVGLVGWLRRTRSSLFG